MGESGENETRAQAAGARAPFLGWHPPGQPDVVAVVPAPVPVPAGVHGEVHGQQLVLRVRQRDHGCAGQKTRF